MIKDIKIKTKRTEEFGKGVGSVKAVKYLKTNKWYRIGRSGPNFPLV